MVVAYLCQVVQILKNRRFSKINSMGNTMRCKKCCCQVVYVSSLEQKFIWKTSDSCSSSVRTKLTSPACGRNLIVVMPLDSRSWSKEWSVNKGLFKERKFTNLRNYSKWSRNLVQSIKVRVTVVSIIRECWIKHVSPLRGCRHVLSGTPLRLAFIINQIETNNLTNKMVWVLTKKINNNGKVYI